MTRNSSILEWQSDEHIGTDEDDIQTYSVGSGDNVTSITIPITYIRHTSQCDGGEPKNNSDSVSSAHHSVKPLSNFIGDLWHQQPRTKADNHF